MRGKRIFLIVFILILLFSCRCLAADQISCVLQVDEWTWKPGKEATLNGEIRNEGDLLENAVLQLELSEITVGDSGRVAFTSFNDERILARKQKDRFETDLTAGEENTFTASWFLPEDMSGIDRVRIRMTVSDSNGNIVAESEIRVGGEEEEQTDSRVGKLLAVLRIATPALLISGVLLWAAALWRNRRIKKRYKGE